ncbi:MAG TPA: phage baseplate assembly protein V [Bacteroidia bacterium]|nr:phage baseplate assembly protein V [Bacteroidia bacterium]
MSNNPTPVVTIKIQNFSGTVIYSNLVIEQPVLGHSVFSFIWSVGDFKADVDFQLDVIKNYMGSVVDITLGNNSFSGIITQISVDERSSASHAFAIKGFSPTILLDDIPKSSSHYKKSLDDIITKSFSGIQGNKLSKDIKAINKDILHYTTQYNETDWQFISRLATRFGEWCYYDGTKLAFGQMGDSGVKLVNGVDVKRVIIRASLQPHQFSYKSYDPFKGESLSKTMGSFSSEIKNDFSSLAVKISKDLYAREDERSMHTFNVVDKKQMDSMQSMEKNSIAAKMLIVKGEGTHPGLKAGCRFQLESQGNTYDFVAISITHFSNLLGHYENAFVAIPSSVKAPTYTDPHVFRKGEMQTATVVENHDSDGIGRIKVRFHWQQSSEMTPWIRVTTPHAGGGKGMHFIPEKGEEVVVDFDGGDIDKPFVLGSLYHGGAKSGKGDGDNTIKSLMTKSGNSLILDDKNGSVSVIDKAGNSVVLKGDGTIIISSSKSITLDSEEINLKASKNINIEAQSSVNVKATMEKINIEAMQDVSIKSSTMAVKIDAMTEFTASGKVKASVESAILMLKASGITSVEGAIVKLN